MEPSIVTPEMLIQHSPEQIKTLLFIGYAIVGALVITIGFLWRHILKKDADLAQMNEYVRNQDKDNIQILNNLANLLTNIENNLNRIPDDTSNKIHIMFNEFISKNNK